MTILVARQHGDWRQEKGLVLAKIGHKMPQNPILIVEAPILLASPGFRFEPVHCICDILASMATSHMVRSAIGHTLCVSYAGRGPQLGTTTM